MGFEDKAVGSWFLCHKKLLFWTYKLVKQQIVLQASSHLNLYRLLALSLNIYNINNLYIHGILTLFSQTQANHQLKTSYTAKQKAHLNEKHALASIIRLCRIVYNFNKIINTVHSIISILLSIFVFSSKYWHLRHGLKEFKNSGCYSQFSQM